MWEKIKKLFGSKPTPVKDFEVGDKVEVIVDHETIGFSYEGKTITKVAKTKGEIGVIKSKRANPYLVGKDNIQFTITFNKNLFNYGDYIFLAEDLKKLK